MTSSFSVHSYRLWNNPACSHQFTTNRPGIPIYDNRLRQAYFSYFPLSYTSHSTSENKERLTTRSWNWPLTFSQWQGLQFVLSYYFPNELSRRDLCKRDKVAVWACARCKKQKRNVIIVHVSTCILQSYCKDSKEISWPTVGGQGKVAGRMQVSVQ
jgi:hypothetical protein